jgi:DNA mismatch repair protein MutS
MTKFNLFQNKKFKDFEKCVISDNEKKDIIEQIINPNIVNTNLTKEFEYDLELTQGNYNIYDNSIISKLNYTHTIVGFSYLKNILLNPLNNKKELENRQNIIKKINKLDNSEIKSGLVKLKNAENDILWLWKENDKEVDQFLNSVYFSNRFLKHFNNSSKILNAYSYYKIIFSPLVGALYPIVAILIPYIIVRVIFKVPIQFSFYYKLVSSTMGIGKNILPIASSNKLFKLSKFISSFLWLLIYVQNTYYSINYSINTNKIINIIHKKMISITEYINYAKKLNDLTKNILNINIDIPFSNLDHSVFSMEPKLFSNKGIILKKYKEILDNKDKLIPIINFVGKIDLYFSICTLYNTNQKINKYSFSSFIDSDKPIIDIEELWHPFLNNNSVVKNNIKLDNESNIIITGPNAGGKSTFIKALMLSVLLSQTLTISPCNIIKLTPFNLLSTYLNIPDCKGKESLFEAEMNRSLTFINKIKQLKDTNKFSFVIMDEIFNSTNPKEGISGAYAICKKINNYKNNISVITTHFNYLAKLEKYNFKNYKIPIKNIDNKIIYPYKINPGISDQFIAIELLKDKGFDKEIINDAKEIYKDLNDDKNKKKKKKKVKKTKVNNKKIEGKTKDNCKGLKS